MLCSAYVSLIRNLRDELNALDYEGYVVPESLLEQVMELHPESEVFNEDRIAYLFAKLRDLPRHPDFGYVQPNDLEAIRKSRPDGPRRLDVTLSESDLLDRFHGAWTGRICGCALGKPVEGWSYNRIRRLLEARGEWELDSYFSSGNGELSCPASCRENIKYMEPDDDVHYTLIGLAVLEKYGPDFKWNDVAETWKDLLPYSALCTAEAQAFMNYNIRTPLRPEDRQGTTPEFTRRNLNPYREWIGAQIRADAWAYACAGNPELAAEFAWRDAHWTHTANGIYGEMFMAAVIAAAFVESDPEELIRIGLSEIPEDCRLAEAVRNALVWINECRCFEAFIEKLYKEFDGMSWVHTMNNALIVVMSLFYGKMDPDRSLCISVMGGLDTDCNGATTGSIVGAQRGYKNFGGKLAAPLNDMIKPRVLGFHDITCSELAARTLCVWRKCRDYKKL